MSRLQRARPLLLGLLVLVIYGAAVYWSLARVGFDPMDFVCVGTIYSEQDPAGNIGYDGQFFYYIADDPLDAGMLLDGPAWRYQRILYPMLARTLALGQHDWIPWTLILINLIATSASAMLLSQLAICRRVGSVYLLAFSLWVGYSFAIRRDLAESLCFALVLAALSLFEKDRFAWAAVVCSLAVMTKEMALPFALGFVAHLTLKGRLKQAITFAIITLMPYLGFQLFLKLQFGTFGFQSPGARFEYLPLAGITEAKPVDRALSAICLVLPYTVVTGLAIWESTHRRSLSLHTLFLILHLPLVYFLPGPSYVDFPTAARVLMGAVLAVFLWVAAAKSRIGWMALSVLWLSISIVYFLLIFVW